MDVIPDPIEIDGGVDTVVLQQRYGDTGDGRGFHIGKGALQDAQAGDAYDRLDFPRLNERHDDRGAFRDEDRIAEALRFRLQILNGAKSALLAEQPEFIERRRAFALHPKALRKQQEAPLVRDAGERSRHISFKIRTPSSPGRSGRIRASPPAIR